MCDCYNRRMGPRSKLVEYLEEWADRFASEQQSELEQQLASEQHWELEQYLASEKYPAFVPQLQPEKHIVCSDRLVIDSNFSPVSPQFDPFKVQQHLKTLEFPHLSRSVIKSHWKSRLSLGFMATHSPAMTGTPGDACSMARVYSVGELLHMRDALPSVTCDMKKLNPDVFPDIIKFPGDARSNAKSKTRSVRELSSASSSSHNSRLLPDSEQSSSEFMQPPRSPDDHEDVILFRGNLDLQPHEPKKMWLLGRRDGSDRTSQPFPPPSGFEAQKAENFRKFYAAVISPTHLRVTAGGRIVPNTRGLPHATFTWNAEKQFFESTGRTFNPELERPGAWLQGISLNNADTHSPLGIVRPSVENVFGQPLHAHSSPESKNTERRVGATPTAVENPDSEKESLMDDSNVTATQGQVKISPPSQFDLTRPFFINGQPFYPAPPGLQVSANVPVLPFNMLGNPGASYQSFVPPHGILSSAPLQLPTGNFYLPQMTLEGQYAGQQGPSMQIPGFAHPMMSPQVHTQVPQPFSTVPVFPQPSTHDEPIPMLPQSVILEHQIQALQQQLRQCENQLQNNKHQIDEQHVMYQQGQLQNQMRMLQSGLNPQGFQPGLLPQEPYGPSTWNHGAGRTAVPLTPFTLRGGVARRNDNLENYHPNSTGYSSTSHGDSVPESAGAAGTHISVSGDSNRKVTPMKPALPSRKRLSAAAAMAPEFQPRSQLTIASQSGAREDLSDVKNASPHGKGESRLLSNVTNSSKPGQWANPSLMHGPAVISNTPMMQKLTRGNNFPHLPVVIPIQTPFKIPSASGQEFSATTVGSFPYLTGYPPPGMPANSVGSADMVYPRELTEDELRARQLYWGKAPRDLSKGLPKFDGKDFYPPSPEKLPVNTTAQLSHTKSGFVQKSDTLRSMQDPSPSKSSRSKVNSASLREPEDFKDPFQGSSGLGKLNYEAPATEGTSKPEGERASDDSWGLTKAEEEEIFKRPTAKTSVFNERQSSFDNTPSMKPERIDTSEHIKSGQGQPKFLRDMLRQNSRTTMAAPTDALSSATAHGYLPQYGGAAAALLTPSPIGFSGTHLPALVGNQAFSDHSAIQGGSSATRLLKKVKGKEKETFDPDFTLDTDGVGPVNRGEEW